MTIAVVGFQGSTAVPLRAKAVLKETSETEAATKSDAAERPPDAPGSDVPGQQRLQAEPDREPGEVDERRRGDDAGGVRLAVVVHNRLKALTG